jgi:hypothetical protein
MPRRSAQIEGIAEAGFGVSGDVQARPMTPSEAA